jgi:hypothetical protein
MPEKTLSFAHPLKKARTLLQRGAKTQYGMDVLQNWRVWQMQARLLLQYREHGHLSCNIQRFETLGRLVTGRKKLIDEKKR